MKEKECSRELGCENDRSYAQGPQAKLFAKVFLLMMKSIFINCELAVQIVQIAYTHKS